jgi:hypothetical protein
MKGKKDGWMTRPVDEMRMADLRKECDELTAIFVTIVKRSKNN